MELSWPLTGSGVVFLSTTMSCYWYGITTTFLAHHSCQEQISIMLNEIHLKVGYDPYSTREVQLLVSYLLTDAFVHKTLLALLLAVLF
jgi:hypothetical protein